MADFGQSIFGQPIWPANFGQSILANISGSWLVVWPIWAIHLKNNRRLRGRRGVKRQPEISKRAHFRVPSLQTPPKFHEKTPQETQKEHNGGGREKTRNFGPPTLCRPTMTHTRSRNGLAKIGLAKLGLAQIGVGQNSRAKTKMAKNGLAKIGQIKTAKTGLAKVGLSRHKHGRDITFISTLSFWTMIWAICASVDVSKYLDILNVGFSTKMVHLPF